MSTKMYDAQAGTIKVEDIATEESNRLVLGNLRNNVEGSMDLGHEEKEQLWIREVIEDHTDYRPEGVHDMGWLGYFVGKHSYLEALYIRGFETISGTSFNDLIMPFLNGLNNNKSIKICQNVIF